MSVESPDARPVPRMPSRPANPMPAGACDAHAHVFGSSERFPLALASSYAPPQAPFELYREMLDRIGADRGVLVQPAPYGTDAAALTDALRRGEGRLRGIAVATAAIGDPELEALNAAGVRGLRFVEMRDLSGNRFNGSVGLDELPGLAPRMRELGWHAQVWGRCDDVAARLPNLVALGVPLVLDHMGVPQVEEGPAGPSFRTLLSLVSEGRVWVKLSVCRVSQRAPDYDDARPFHDALVAANPDRLLWGSDWPFVRMGDRSPDVGRLVDLFFTWVGDETLRRTILVNNPAAIYGFPAP